MKALPLGKGSMEGGKCDMWGGARGLQHAQSRRGVEIELIKAFLGKAFSRCEVGRMHGQQRK